MRTELSKMAANVPSLREMGLVPSFCQHTLFLADELTHTHTHMETQAQTKLTFHSPIDEARFTPEAPALHKS